MLLNWNEIAMTSEVEFFVAYGGEIRYFHNFIHIHNDTIPWGDYS